MRYLTGLLITFVIALPLFAQTPSGPVNVPGGDKLDAAKTAAYYTHYRDEIRAKEAFEASRKMLHTQAFKNALHDAHSTLPQLAVTLDRFVTATGIMFDAVQLGLPHGIMRKDAKVTLFGEITDGRAVSWRISRSRAAWPSRRAISSSSACCS